jgi:hypothetical protein
MVSKNTAPMSEAEILRCWALLGPAPILSSEDCKDFEETFRLVARCVQPHNMIEVVYLWHFVCASWLIKRYSRHATVAIERVAQDTRKFHAERARLRQQRQSNQVCVEVEKLTQTPADVAQLVRMENNFDAMVKETDAIFEGITEREHNKALQQNIVFQEQLNALIISQTAIRNDSLRQLELFRIGLGQLAAEVTEKILDGESKEVTALPHEADALSIVPSESPTTNDVEPQNRSEPA